MLPAEMNEKGYSPDAQSAVQFGNMAKKYGILYYEEPVVPHEDTLAYVHQQTGIPVASGERIYSRCRTQPQGGDTSAVLRGAETNCSDSHRVGFAAI